MRVLDLLAKMGRIVEREAVTRQPDRRRQHLRRAEAGRSARGALPSRRPRPGTATASPPCWRRSGCGMPLSRKRSGVAPAGARSRKSSANDEPPASRTSAKPPPPTPHDDACTTQPVAAAAIGRVRGAAAEPQHLRTGLGSEAVLGGDGAATGIGGQRRSASRRASARMARRSTRGRYRRRSSSGKRLPLRRRVLRGRRAMAKPPRRRRGAQPYGEKEFYLEEFRGRSVLIAVAPAVGGERGRRSSRSARRSTALVRNDTPVVVWWPHVAAALRAAAPRGARPRARARSHARTASGAACAGAACPRRCCACRSATLDLPQQRRRPAQRAVVAAANETGCASSP